MSSSATPAGAASPDAGGDGVSKMAKDSQKAAAALDAITDHVDEQEIDSSASAALKDSMQAMLGGTKSGKATAKASRDKELAKVKIQQSDIDVIVGELELDPKTAERALRESQGNLVKALCALVDS